MAEAQPSGLAKYNPEASDFVPREHLNQHHSNWRNHGRTENNRNWSRNCNVASYPQHVPQREGNNDSPSQKVHSYNSTGTANSARGQQGSPDIPNKPVKHHSFQNQRWHRSRSERSHNRNHSRQPLSDTSSRSSFVATTPLGDWRLRTRDPSDLCSSESEKEVGSADSRGAKPKRLTHVSGGSLRGPRDKTRHSYDREKRVASKQKTDELFENIPPRDFRKTGASKEDRFKTRLDRHDGAAEDKQKHLSSGNRASRETLDWKKPPSDAQIFKQNEAQSNKLSKLDKSQAAAFASKEKTIDQGTEPPQSNTYQEPKSRGHHWITDRDKPAGRKHPPQDRASKSSVQPGFGRQWKKHDIPKSKETHTGSLIEQLTAEKYECMVCCEVIRVMAPVWSCQSCYHVFHLNCIKKWARSPASQAEDGNSGWRCPACQNVSSRAPSTYTCFCGKVNHPEWNRNEIPHSCGELCGKKRAGLDCPHTCNILCHPGPCPSCPAFMTKTCECGRTSQSVRCGQSSTMHCANICGNPLNCGEHNCNQVCHAGKCQPCQQIIHQDYIHTCENLCHEGECGPCSRTSNISCRCGFKLKEVPCALIQNEEDFTFICDKRCNKKRQCGRHKCNEICCVDKEHKCSLICGHKLNCGLHRCDQPCHRGNCQNCWQTSFDELTCYCGESVIYPPVPCGTRPPECKNPCTRQHECDHPVFHSCHSEDKCPPCTYLTQKWCMGKHELRNNIPCHLTDISCGLRCNQLLKCAMHKCKRICHKGECLIDEDCKQPCILPRPDCGHPCLAPCHPSQPCAPSTCTAMVDLQCECGRRKESVVCSAASSAYQRIAAISVAAKLTEMQLGDSVDIGKLVTKKEIKQTRLQCDEECLALERNRRLAEALNITETSDPFNTRSGFKFSDSLKDDARKDLKFVSEIEREVKALVDAVNKGKQTKKSHCFPPMNRDHRKIIHDLAEVYGVESVSYDNEPKRNVVITAVKGKSMCPNVSLMSVIEREIQARPPPPIAHYRHQAERNGGSSGPQKSMREEPIIDYFDVQD
ncbi:hypothetical protein GDO81_011896 [Engystomops pustulosus]|uniref:Transcriptional repressor NF-X1 n=1 Tax=Engystomops pustulosus TaxID=76066 RepID=A0AAV7BHH4_ENGPU|nr:hypothetical protein GDO81_011896 [Engystomops pustulosus]